MKKTAEPCKFVKSNGDPCGGFKTSDSDYCFYHDPSKSEEVSKAGRKGGLRGGPTTLPADTPDVSLNSAQDVAALMAQTISQVRRGQIDPKIATAVGYLSNIALKAREQGDLEDRINALETEVKQNRGGDVTRIRKTG